MKRRIRCGSTRILGLVIGLLATVRGFAATLPLPFTNAPSITTINDLWQQITNSGYPTLYAGTTNDSKVFRGVFVANANSPDVKLALHSDDGSTVTIDDQPTGVADLGTDTHLKESASLKMLTNTFIPGQQYCVQIQYSNQALTTNDQDGVTLYAYNGSGTVAFGPRVTGPDAICVGVSTNLLADCGTAPYSWSNNTPTLLSLTGGGGITGLSSGTASVTVRDAETNATTRTINVVKPGISPAFLTNCIGLTNVFVLTNSAGTGIVTWSKSGLLTGNGRTNSLAFTNAGTNVLTADYAGCSSSATVIVVAVSSLLPVTTNFCGSGTVPYTNQTIPPGFSQYVNWGGEGLSGTGSSRTNSYSGLGPHIVSNWCGTSVKYSTATVHRIDIAQTNATVLADATAPVTFYLTNSYGAATWQIAPSPGGGASFAGGNSGNTVTINPGSVGTNYAITASADAMPSCSDTATLQVVKVTFFTNLVAFCEGTNASVAMTVSPSNFLSSLTFDTVTNVATGTPNTVASVTVASTTNLTLNPVSPGTATLRVRLGGTTFFGPVIKVVRVTFPTNAWYVGLGRSANFSVEVVPPDAPVTYVSKDSAIVGASGSGTTAAANGVAFGTTKIIAVVGSSGCAEKEITVARVTFNPSPLYICVGQSAQSTATVTPSNAPVAYYPDDPTVVSGTVSGNILTITSLTNSQTHVLAKVGESVLGTLPVYGLRVQFEAKPFGVATGKTLRVVATVLPSGLSKKVDFSTYHPTTAQVVSVSYSNAKPVITILGITNGFTGLAAHIGTNQLCNYRNITVASLGLDTVLFTGTNRYPILKDDGSGYYSESSHWSQTNSVPIAYIRNTYPALSARLTVNPSSASEQILIKGEGSYPIPITTNTPSGGYVSSAWKYALNPLPNSVNRINPFVVNWKASLDGGDTFVDVGASANKVYVILGQPLNTTNWFHTVFDVSCRNAVGHTVPANIISGIWNDFSGPIPGVLRADNVEMVYWGPTSVAGAFSNICLTTPDLVRYADGKCNAWADFFTDTILLQGITVPTVTGITTKDLPGSGLLGNGFTVYPGLPGQGNASPTSNFLNHAVVKLGGIIYDPSYGQVYPMGELSWEDASLHTLTYKDAFGTVFNYPDAKGTQETQFNP